MVSDRLQAWIRQRFEPHEVERSLTLLADAVPGESGGTIEVVERVQAAVVLLSDGNGKVARQA